MRTIDFGMVFIFEIYYVRPFCSCRKLLLLKTIQKKEHTLCIHKRNRIYLCAYMFVGLRIGNKNRKEKKRREKKRKGKELMNQNICCKIQSKYRQIKINLMISFAMSCIRFPSIYQIFYFNASLHSRKWWRSVL